jgi:hypothetical protein
VGKIKALNDLALFYSKQLNDLATTLASFKVLRRIARVLSFLLIELILLPAKIRAARRRA